MPQKTEKHFYSPNAMRLRIISDNSWESSNKTYMKDVFLFADRGTQK